MKRLKTIPSNPKPMRRGRWSFWLLTGFVAVFSFYIALTWPGPLRLLNANLGVENASSLPVRGGLTCDVAYINDGDTLRCRDGTRIRLHAVAARESDESCAPGHPCPSASAAEATAVLTRLASGRTIHCERTGQSYNRITAICWTPEGVEINCELIRSGVAVVWDRYNRERPLCRA